MFCQIDRVALGLVFFITAGQSLEADLMTFEFTGPDDSNDFYVVHTVDETSSPYTSDPDAVLDCFEVDVTTISTLEGYDIVLTPLIPGDSIIPGDSTSIVAPSDPLVISASDLSDIDLSDSGTLLCFAFSSYDESGQQANPIEPVLERGDTSETSDSVVPEPHTMALFGLGSLGIGLIARRRKKKLADLAA